MIKHIEAFLASKTISENTLKSYRYDLNQFLMLIDHKLSDEKLVLYQKSLNHLSASAKKRKFSTVNQFLHYLYKVNVTDRFFELSGKVSLPSTKVPFTYQLDDKRFYQKTQHPSGQLIALLILELGLLPSELSKLRLSEIDLDFQLIRVDNGSTVKVLSFSQAILKHLSEMEVGSTYLFENKGKPYSRQWFFNQLNAFLLEIGYDQLSAQSLREQFIIREKEKGTSLMELTQKLRLKSPITLEKYYRL